MTRTIRPGRAVAVATAALLLLAACGAPGPGGAADAGTAITIASGYLPASADLDPRDAASQQLAPFVTTSVAGTLFGYHDPAAPDPNSAPELVAPGPELATSAELSPDGLTWTVQLREGVRSEAGNPLTAEDVVWTVERAFAAEAIASNLLTRTVALDPAEPVRATGPLTVEFRLATPSSVLEKVFSQPWLGILDRTAITAGAGPGDPWGFDWLATRSATFGPYRVATSELPQRVVLEANPNYWRGPATVARATIVVIADNSTRLQAALTGEVDLAMGLASTDLPTVEQSDAVTPYIQPNAIQMKLLAFRLASPEVADARVRRALSLSIDRQAISDSVYAGLSEPVTGCMPALLDDRTSAADVPASGDRDEARALIAEVPGEQAVTVGYLPDIGNTFAQILQAGFEDIGVRTTLKPYTSFSTWKADLQNGVFGVGINGFAPFVNDPGYLLVNLATSTAPSNATGWAVPAFDTAAATALSAGGAEKDAAVDTACGLLRQDSPIVPVVSTAQLAAAGDRLAKVASSQYGVLLYPMAVTG